MKRNIESNIWYYHTIENNYLIWFAETIKLSDGMVDAIAVTNGKVNKGRVYLKTIMETVLPDSVIVAPNQETLNLLYVK